MGAKALTAAYCPGFRSAHKSAPKPPMECPITLERPTSNTAKFELKKRGSSSVMYVCMR